jgi:predicted GIY-YIG superfamily endonuclease
LKLAAKTATTAVIIRQMALAPSPSSAKPLIAVFFAAPPHIMATYQETELVPRTSGIYLIRCQPTGKIYVGSAVDLRGRWDIHRRMLNKRTHHNDPLQAAWNLFGETEFKFEILEYVPKSQLLTAEQKWIDQTRCTDRNVGFGADNYKSRRILPQEWARKDTHGGSGKRSNCEPPRLDTSTG